MLRYPNVLDTVRLRKLAEQTTGTVAVGKRADLVLIKGNPLQNIAHTAETSWGG